MAREGREWVFVDCGLWEDPRIIEAGRDAKDLFLAALGYCGANLTDGFVTAKAMPNLAVRAMMTLDEAVDAADALVREGLWTDTKGGWCVTRYLNWQRSRADAEDERRRAAEKRVKGKERLAEWRRQQAIAALTSEDAPVTRYNGNALQHALRNATEERRGDIELGPLAKPPRKASQPISADARRLAGLLLDKWFELKPNATRIEVSNASKRGIQKLLDEGPPGAKAGVTPEQVERMIELLHTRGREEWPGKGTCWAEQVKSGEKLRAKWTDFEGKWLNETAAQPNGRLERGLYVKPGLAVTESELANGAYDPEQDTHGLAEIERSNHEAEERERRTRERT